MYPHESAYGKAPNPVPSYFLDIMTLGPCTADYLAADQRHMEDQRYAAHWMATHQDRKQTPRAWRQWSGKLLVRVGHRLQGAAPTLGSDIQPATH
jgi:hypothetical protein